MGSVASLQGVYIPIHIDLIYIHDDVIKWKHYPRYWPFVRGIHRWPVNSPHKDHWRGALMCSLICVWINDWVNNREAGDLRRYRAHYDVTVMRVWLTHWGRNKMADIYQTTFSNVFSWMKMYKFRVRFHWSSSPRIQLTIFRHWFR